MSTSGDIRTMAHADTTVATAPRIDSRLLVEDSVRDLNVVKPFAAVSP
jgi:hypothetical protein